MIRIVVFTIVLFSCLGTTIAQVETVEQGHQKFPLTGNFYFDSNHQSDAMGSVPLEDPQPQKKKIPVLGALFSAAIPGTGDLYAESYLSAGVFLAAEILLLGSYFYFENEANDLEVQYQAIANDPENGWNVTKYANYLIANANNPTAMEKALQLQTLITGSDPENLPPGDRIWWAQLNALEREMLYEHGGKNKFSHTLPAYDSQQYYELIGKYDQFVPGWYDYNDANSLSQIQYLTTAFKKYRDKRTEANEFHNVAGRFALLTMLNHTVSAINSFIQTHNWNQTVSVASESSLTGLFNPTVTLSFRF